MSYFTALRQELETYLEPDQVQLVEQAYILARDAHRGQKRLSGEAYITHPVAAAMILAHMRLDHQSLMATLLHDVIEDTSVSKETITQQFGETVALLVDGVSKLAQIKFESQAEAQAENFQKMVLAMVRDIRVILVKLADRLHNMRTLEHMPEHKRHRIAHETLDIYAPVAHRLGMHAFYTELEDLGFKALYPMRYRILQNAVKKALGNRREIVHEIKTKMEKALTEHHIPYLKILGRHKHLYSIYTKMRGKRASFSEIMDVYGFRIIVDSLDNCYRALGAIHGIYKPRHRRFKDYIAIPKANGYQSLHTTLFGTHGVPIELQIRTEEMDHLAESGIAAHWRYKIGLTEEDPAHRRAREWINKLLEAQQNAASSIEFIENVKVDLYPDMVFVFSPKGHIIELPRGSTPVDFAYAIHSDIGNSCIAAKIDRRLAPLSQSLVNGQSVEVITAPGARPNPAWLNFVATGKARSNIRYFLKTQQLTESITLGKRLLEKALISLGSSLKDYPQEKIQEVVQEHHLTDLDDLLREIGLGNQVPLVIAKQLLSMDAEFSAESQPLIEPGQPLMIKGTEGMVLRFSECCRPIPGDPIVGCLIAGKGIMVHRDICAKVANFRDHPEKFIDMCWEDNVKGEFPVDLIIETENRRGVLALIASAISKADANIENISVDPRDGRYSAVHICVNVHDRVHLARVIRRIRALTLVHKITRSRKKGGGHAKKNY